jgi:hypothetical protein
VTSAVSTNLESQPMAATPEETAIAEWMRDEFTREGRLSQKRAVTEIRQQFGVQHLYRNKSRNWAINKPILDEFQRLTPDDTVWSLSRKLWRLRRPADPLDSRMVR